MKRRNFLRQSGLSAGMLLMNSKALLAGIFHQNAYQMKELRGNVGIFTERGGTIAYLITPEGMAVVDSQFPEQAGHLIDELKKRSEKPLKFLINTHHHGDHSGGNIAFKGMAEHVVAHENSLKNQRAVAEKANTLDKQLLPDLTFTDTWKQKLGKETIKTYYFGPGHTNGDSIIHFENANIAHMGDLLFNRRYPFVDRAAGASVKNWANVLDKTLKQFDNKTLFVCGHAFDPEKIVIGKEDIKVFGDYLSRLRDFAEKEVKAGKSKEDFLKNTSVPGVTAMQGDGIQRSLQAAYEEVAGT